MFSKTRYDKVGLTIEFLTTVIRSICILTILTLLAASCKPISKVGNNNVLRQSIAKEDFKQLNGTFSNSFDTIFGGINHSPNDALSNYQRLTILSQLFNNYPESAWRDETGEMIKEKEKWIKVEFSSPKTATISMYHNDKFIFSKNIHGKFKKGYFYLRPKVYILPFIPLLFGYNFQRTRIGKTMDNNLIIDYSVNCLGFAVIAGSTEWGSASTIYQMKNK